MSCLEHLDVTALPLNTPLLLMTVEGFLLDDDYMDGIVPFVELQPAQGGVVQIRRSGSCRALDSACNFDPEDGAEFETLSTPSGMVVFEKCSQEHCLGITMEGRSRFVKCDKAYEGKWQEWLLLKPLLPPSLLVNGLAAASLSDPDARRQLIWYLLEAGNSSETVAELLKLLHGTTQPLADPNAALSAAERQELVLKLDKMRMSMGEVGAMMALLYPTNDPTMIKREHATGEAKVATTAQVGCSVDCGGQYVTVDHDHTEFDTIPLNSPVVMVSSTGFALSSVQTGSCFVELSYSNDGLVTIRSADDKSKCLGLNAYRQCVFGRADVALKFKTRMTSAGQLVLVEHLTGCVLEGEAQGQTNLVVCRNLYSDESQSWLLFTACKGDSCAPNGTKLGLQKMKHSPDARRQLIMEFALDRKSSKDIGEALKLIYRSAVPDQALSVTNELQIERLQRILTLFEGRVSTQRIGEFLTMMYGTSDPL